MNNAHRALLRILLTAGALLLLPHIPGLGFVFHGTILSALVLGVIFEVVLWVSVIAYSVGAAFLGAEPRELPVIVNVATFLAVATGFLKLTSLIAPSLLVLPGILPAFAGALSLLAICWGVLSTAKSRCGCSHARDDDEDEPAGKAK